MPKIEPTSDMLKYADFAKKLARRSFGIDIEVKFTEWDGEVAQYHDKTLSLNLRVVPKEFFESFSTPLLELTIQELSHEAENHTGCNYSQTCAKLGAELIMCAIKDPGLFGLDISRLER